MGLVYRMVSHGFEPDVICVILCKGSTVYYIPPLSPKPEDILRSITGLSSDLTLQRLEVEVDERL